MAACYPEDLRTKVEAFIERRERILDQLRDILVRTIRISLPKPAIDPDVILFGTGLALDSRPRSLTAAGATARLRCPTSVFAGGCGTTLIVLMQATLHVEAREAELIVVAGAGIADEDLAILGADPRVERAAGSVRAARMRSTGLEARNLVPRAPGNTRARG